MWKKKDKACIKEKDKAHTQHQHHKIVITPR